jgi:hypothetical protein
MDRVTLYHRCANPRCRREVRPHPAVRPPAMAVCGCGWFHCVTDGGLVGLGAGTVFTVWLYHGDVLGRVAADAAEAARHPQLPRRRRGLRRNEAIRRQAALN